ncbi:MAG: D-aminoacyl-tRNA deacylase [Nanoarchaeota archaeon]
MEATHHCTYLQKPAMFIEIGSSEEQWTNKSYGRMIADTIMRTLSKPIKTYKTVIAIGGGHYPREFNKVLLRTDLTIGHICPKYALESLTEGMLRQAVERNVEKVDTVILDWKGLGEHKDRVTSMIENLGLKSERLQTILKNYIN